MTNRPSELNITPTYRNRREYDMTTLADTRFDSNDFEVFFNAYEAAALWASIGEDGLPLDHPEASHNGLSREASDLMMADCEAFLISVHSRGLSFDYGHPRYADLELAGHDFWLTRNGHGAGFWDRGLADGEKLTEMAKRWGEADLYEGDNGYLYHFPG